MTRGAPEAAHTPRRILTPLSGVMVGAGSLAPYLIRAHSAVRPIREVRIWSRDMNNAVSLAARLKVPDVKLSPVESLQGSAGWADIISCATLSEAPLIKGEWLSAGVHLDLVGACACGSAGRGGRGAP